MTAMSTALIPFSPSANGRTSTLPGHTAVAPRLFIQKRKVPTSVGSNSTVSARVVYATVDSHGEPIGNRVQIGCDAAIPVAGRGADTDAAIVIFRDFVASDEFVTLVKTQIFA